MVRPDFAAPVDARARRGAEERTPERAEKPGVEDQFQDERDQQGRGLGPEVPAADEREPECAGDDRELDQAEGEYGAKLVTAFEDRVEGDEAEGEGGQYDQREPRGFPGDGFDRWNDSGFRPDGRVRGVEKPEAQRGDDGGGQERGGEIPDRGAASEVDETRRGGGVAVEGAIGPLGEPGPFVAGGVDDDDVEREFDEGGDAEDAGERVIIALDLWGDVAREDDDARQAKKALEGAVGEREGDGGVDVQAGREGGDDAGRRGFAGWFG